MSQPITNIDDELEKQLDQDPIFRHILKYAPQSQRDLMQYEIARYFTNKIKEAELRGRILEIDNVLNHGGGTLELNAQAREKLKGRRRILENDIAQLTKQYKGEQDDE